MENKGNRVPSSDFLQVLLALKGNIMRDLNVADIAIVDKDDGPIRCKLLNNEEIKIECEKLKGLTIAKDDLVLVLFTNSDFRNNLKQIRNNQKPQKTSSQSLHNKNYGVIIGIIE